MSGSNDDNISGTTLRPSFYPSAGNLPLPVEEKEACYDVVMQDKSSGSDVSSSSQSIAKEPCGFSNTKNSPITGPVEPGTNDIIKCNDDNQNSNNNNNNNNHLYKRNTSLENCSEDEVFTNITCNTKFNQHLPNDKKHPQHHHHHQQQQQEQCHSLTSTTSEYTPGPSCGVTTTTTTTSSSTSSTSNNTNDALPANDHHTRHINPSTRSLSSSSSSSSLTVSLGSISEEDVLSMMERMGENELNKARPPCDCDDCLLSGDESATSTAMPSKKPLKRQSSWRKIRSFILWSPFIQVFKKHRYPWIQLAGHQGNFQAGDAGSVLKKLDKREQQCFQHLMSDSLKEYVPEYRGNVDKNGDTFIQLQDLLCTFTYPCVMDIKMGVRTYLEEELHKARKSPALRKDMYQKMTEVDPNAPTEEEHEQKAVTKPRYMQWRDQMSSSAEMGFRVEGIKQSDGKSSKDFKKTKERENIVEIIQSYVGSNEKVVGKYLDRLRQIRRAQESSEFFKSHEVVGSSLLFVHDADASVNIWMIDFGKTEQLPAGMSIDHRSTWVEGNREDGYLFGLDNLVSIFEEIFRNLSSSSV